MKDIVNKKKGNTMLVKGTKILMGKDAKVYQDYVDTFRGLVHQSWF